MPADAATAPLTALLAASLDRPAPGTSTSRSPRPRLRSIPGGDVRGLPIVIAPRPGESLPGWLSRVATRYDTAPRGILCSLTGTELRPTTAGGIAKILRDDPVLAYRLGLSSADLQAMTEPTALDEACRGYRNTYPTTIPRAATTHRYCPACLADVDAYWRREWTHPLVMVCTIHAVHLLEHCPRCGRAPFGDGSWISRPVPVHQCTRRRQPAQAHPARTVRAPCRADLRATLTTDATEIEVIAQRLLLSVAADPAAHVTICGVRTRHVVVFDALVELTDALTDHDLSRVTPASLADAATVLASPDLAAAAQRLDELRLLPPHGIHAPIAPAYRIRARPHNPLLVAIQLTRHAASLTPAAHLMFRTRSATPRYPAASQPPPDLTASPKRDVPGEPSPLLRRPQQRPSLNRLRLHGRTPVRAEPDPSWIPQQLWASALPSLDALPADLPPHARKAAAAMAVAKAGNLASWRALTLEMGLPPSAGHAAVALHRAATRARAWPDLLDQIETLLTRLTQHPPPIDYRIRRVVGDNLDLITWSLNHAIKDLDSPASAADLLPAFWEAFTGGHRNYGPHGLASTTGSTTTPTPDPAVLIRAHQYLRRLSAPQVTGPLTWTPP